MTEAQAFNVMALLVAGTDGWNDARFRLWTSKLEKLADPAAAMRVADRIIDTHTSPGGPAWATFKSAYMSEVRTADRRALPAPTVDAIGLGEYVRRCQKRADDGDSEAARHLGTLERIAQQRLTSDEPRWTEALR